MIAMDNNKKFNMMFIFLIIFLCGGLAYSFVIENMEFIYYCGISIIGAMALLSYYKKLHLSNEIFFGIVFLIVFHILGGTIIIGGVRLYDMWFMGLRYDNFMHMLGAFILTLISYNLLKPYLSQKIKTEPIPFALLLILITSGFGAFNEILELFAFVYLGANLGVGGYINNAVDLVFNTVGALIGVTFAFKYHKDKK